MMFPETSYQEVKRRAARQQAITRAMMRLIALALAAAIALVVSNIAVKGLANIAYDAVRLEAAAK